MEKIKEIKKIDLDFEKVKNILELHDFTIRNIEFILLDLKPYRKNIFLQIYGKGNKFNKEWVKYDYKQKYQWIKDVLMTKFSKEEFIDHILKAIAMFNNNKNIMEAIVIALNVNLEEGKIQNG